MRKLSSGAALLVAILVLMAACAPQPPPTRAPTAPPPTAAAPTPAVAPAPKPEDTQWQRVAKAAQQEGKLIMYDASFFVGDLRIAIPKAFKERTGISAEVLVTGGSSATIQRLQVEQRTGMSVADVFASGGLSGPRMISLGFTQEVARALPSLKDKGVFITDPVFSPGGEAVIFGTTLLGVAANSKLVQPGEIKSYKDLMNPKYRGKIIIRDPRLGSGGSAFTLGTFRHLKLLDDDFLRNLVKQQEVVMWGGGESEVAQMIARGEYMVNMGAGIDIFYASLTVEGAPVMPVYMQEGTVGDIGVIQMSKQAPHPNSARVFIDWLLTAEGQSVYHKVRATSPMRKDVPNFMPPALTKEPMPKFIPITWELSQALNKMIADNDFENVFGKR